MESSDSSAPRITRTAKEEKLLGHKRGSKVLKENYLVRRILSGRIAGKYEHLANSFYSMMAFDWDEEKIGKLRSNISKSY